MTKIITLGFYSILLITLSASLAGCADLKPVRPASEIILNEIKVIPSIEPPSEQIRTNEDEVLFGGKFRVDIDGQPAAVTAFSGGGVTFEKKEATEGERPPDYPMDRKYFIITKVNWQNITLERNYQKDKTDWIEWWEKTKNGEVLYKDVTITYLDKKGNDTARHIRAYSTFPIRYNVINFDERSGSSYINEILELSVEYAEYDGYISNNEIQKKPQDPAIGISDIPNQGTVDATKITQVAKFTLDIQGAGGKTPTGAWWSISGGDQNIEIVTYTTGEDQHEQKRPGQMYFSDITLQGPFVNDRKAIMDWINETAKGKGERIDLTLNLLNDKGDNVCSWRFFRAFPVKWEGPSLNAESSAIAVESITLACEYIELEIK